MGFTPQVATALSALVIIGQIIAVCLVLILIKDFLTKQSSNIAQWVSSHGLLLMFIVALVATSGSLFFSEIALFTPCKDCWIQRIFMYPQVLILGLALWKRDRGIAPYILIVALAGMAISTEHYIEQIEAILDPIENDPLKPCDLSGVSCRATYIFEFSYITIPMMALTGFVLNALGSITMMRYKK